MSTDPLVRDARAAVFLSMFRSATFAVSLLLSLILIGCGTEASEPKGSVAASRQRLTPTVRETEPPLAPTFPRTSTPGATPSLSTDWANLLQKAVANLQEAASFELTANEVRAYRVIESDGVTRLVYGEFNSNHTVVRRPVLNVHSSCKYRYDPQAEFMKYETDSYEENGKFYSVQIEGSVPGPTEEIDPQHLEPFAGDVYQTLVTYHDRAEFATERDGKAVYLLEHPAWYELNGAIGFASLGFLQQAEDGEQLIQQYVIERLPNVETVIFIITVNIEEGLILKVEVDDSDFMASLWEEVDRALLEQGAEASTLTRYEVMDVNGAEYFFRNYNQDQAFEIPTMQP
jgi:hypothetical protein